MKKLTILGSSGSIGTQALDLVRNSQGKIKVEALSCNRDIETLEQQIKEFSPQVVAVNDPQKADELRKRVDLEVLTGIEGIVEISKNDTADIVLNSLVGSVGILPTVESIKAGKNVALANKETLVSAGELVMALAKEKNVSILPVDSEHSAIFQCLRGYEPEHLSKVILTCSGGPFKNKKTCDLKHVTLQDTLNHPNWAMGNKITIDSATLMNKGFEVIEAKMLFDLEYNQIDVVVHPQSIIHSMIQLKNSSVLAQLGYPDMRLPIHYALFYPHIEEYDLETIDFSKLGTLFFDEPDIETFPCLQYAFEAGEAGGTLPCVLNAANEVAVQAFLEGRISFLDIPAIIKKKMDEHRGNSRYDLEEILHLDAVTKSETKKEIYS